MNETAQAREGQAATPPAGPGVLNETLAERALRALEFVQQVERFGPGERLDRIIGLEALATAGGLAGLWSRLNAALGAATSAPPRGRALLEALAVLLGDLQLALAAPGNLQTVPDLLEIWSQPAVDIRLRHHFLTAAGGGRGNGFQPAVKPGGPVDFEEQRLRLARQWEEELMPLAVGLVLCEAGVVSRQEDWRQLVRGRPDRVSRAAPRTRAQKAFIQRLSEVLPEAVTRLRDDLEKLFWDDDPIQWYTRKPPPGYVAVILRSLLYRGARGQCRPGRAEPDPRERVGGEDDGRRFLEALKALLQKGMQDKVQKNLRALDAELGTVQTNKLLAHLKGLGGDAQFLAKLKSLLDCLSGEQPPTKPAQPEDSLQDALGDILAEAAAQALEDAETPPEGADDIANRISETAKLNEDQRQSLRDGIRRSRKARAAKSAA